MKRARAPEDRIKDTFAANIVCPNRANAIVKHGATSVINNIIPFLLSETVGGFAPLCCFAVVNLKRPLSNVRKIKSPTINVAAPCRMP